MATRRSDTIKFIDTNPATDAYNEGVAQYQKRMIADQAIESRMLENAENLKAAPTRLRNLSAVTNRNETAADVARRTADFDVSRAQSDARRSGAEADVSVGTVGSRIATSGSNATAAGAQARTAVSSAKTTEATEQDRLDTSGANTRTAVSNANVAQQTERDKVATSGAGARTAVSSAHVAEMTQGDKIASSGLSVEGQRVGLRQARATALNTEMQGFYKSLEALNAGRVDEAIAIAKQTGQEIPEAIISNAELRAAVTEAAKTAPQLYPNRPRDQQSYIEGFIKAMAERQAHGQRLNDPTAAYTVPGAPQPPELATQTQKQPPAEVATAEWLVANRVAPNAAAAFEMVKQSKANPAQMRVTVFNAALRSTFGDQAKANKIADEFMASIGHGAAAPRPAPQSQYRDGQTATNPQTGQKLIFRNGQWQPQ